MPMSILALALLFATLTFQPTTVNEPAPASDLAGVKAELRKRWPDNRPLNIVCHGHSVPAGYHRTPDVRPFESYPHLLHRHLQTAYPTSTVSVIVTAIGGEHAEAGAARFDADVLAKNPDVITIDYSLNDRAIGLDRARAAWTSMILRAEAAGVPVILLTPTPDLRADLADPGDPLNRHAEQVRRLAAEHDLALVDSLAAFGRVADRGVDLGTLMSQGNHPNAAGHTLVAAELAAWFAP